MSPRTEEIAAESCSEASAARKRGDGPPSATTVPNGTRRSRAAKKAARVAAEAGEETSAASSEREPVQEKPRQCPVFGCTRGHDPGECRTFLDMTPKERLDLIHAKQLCLLCLRHPLSVGCEVAGKGLCL